jgi:hypothetical protein
MVFMDSMDIPDLTPSREKTENTPINHVFTHPIGFEVRRSGVLRVGVSVLHRLFVIRSTSWYLVAPRIYYESK